MGTGASSAHRHRHMGPGQGNLKSSKISFPWGQGYRFGALRRPQSTVPPRPGGLGPMGTGVSPNATSEGISANSSLSSSTRTLKEVFTRQDTQQRNKSHPEISRAKWRMDVALVDLCVGGATNLFIVLNNQTFEKRNVTVEVCIPPVTLQQSIISYLGLISLGMSALSTVFQSYSDFTLKKLAAKTEIQTPSNVEMHDAQISSTSEMV